MDAQIKKGILEMVLLFKLSQQDYYGYLLMKEMNNIFPDVSDSTFYAILRRLNREGAASVYYGAESGGPKRKYYTITDKGKIILEEEIADWKNLKDIVSSLGI